MKFTVQVKRTNVSYAVIHVEANSEKSARLKAIKAAKNPEYVMDIFCDSDAPIISNSKRATWRGNNCSKRSERGQV